MAGLIAAIDEEEFEELYKIIRSEANSGRVHLDIFGIGS